MHVGDHVVRGEVDLVGVVVVGPFDALERIAEPRRQLGQSRLQASLELYDALVTETVEVGERVVPLEVCTSLPGLPSRTSASQKSCQFGTML